MSGNELSEMIDTGKVSVIGVDVDAVDYEAAVQRIITAAIEHRAYRVSALAVHGVMTGVDDPAHLTRLNSFDLVTPDGQPVRWAMNWIHGSGLAERVYGPDLTLAVCRAAVERDLSVYFYGSTEDTLSHLERRLPTLVPGIRIAGTSASTFGISNSDELDAIAHTVRTSGASICFVGLGCPRQEVFVYENADRLQMPCVAVGAAFDFHAGLQTEPPPWIQRAGLQWFHRLLGDPRRLWRRYIILNPRFAWRVVRQRVSGSAMTSSLPVGELPPQIGCS